MKPKRVILCPNPYRDSELKVCRQSRDMLESLGMQTSVCLPFQREGYGEELGLSMRPLQQEIRQADLLIAFGGDGTILHLARTVALHRVPVLGINLGSLGFMSELEVNELDRLRDLAQGRFTVESRMMLDVSVLREGRQVYNNIALNDAVVSKGSIARVVRLDIFTEEGRLTKVGGDGIIVSTPTGSTGYSMAAGGPIVEPTARNLLLTPICPHSTRSSSYVLSPEHVITVEAADANRKFVYLSVDGGKAFSLKNGDQVRVSTSKYTTRLVRLSKKSFCEIIAGILVISQCHVSKCCVGSEHAFCDFSLNSRCCISHVYIPPLRFCFLIFCNLDSAVSSGRHRIEGNTNHVLSRFSYCCLSTCGGCDFLSFFDFRRRNCIANVLDLDFKIITFLYFS